MSSVLARPLHALLAERERWALWLPVGIGCGISLYFALPGEPPLWGGAAALVPAMLLTMLGRQRDLVLILGAAAVAIAAGLTAAQLRTAFVAAPILTREIGPVAVEGRVVEVEPLPRGRRVVLDTPVIEGLAAVETPARIRIRIGGGETLVRPGDRIAVLAGLAPPSPPAAPSAFDFQRHAFFLGIGAVGFAYGQARLVEPRDATTQASSLGLRLADLRQSITDRILARLPGATGAVAAALMTGYQTAVPEPVMDAMRDSGLAHLLSISGLHIGLVAGLLFVGLRGALALVPPLALAYPIKKWAAGAALLGTFFYMLLSGAPVPTQRAFLMTAVMLVAVLLDRRAISMRTVAWAACVILLVTPEALVGASLQMSFAAVAALVAAYEGTRDYRMRQRIGSGLLRRAGLYFAGIALTSVVATLATAPYSVFHFNRLALYGVVANVLAVPLTGLWVMPFAVAAFLLMPFGLEGVALPPMGWGVQAIIDVAEHVAGWPGAVLVVPVMPVAGLAAITFGGLWVCLWDGRWRYLGLGAIAAGVATVGFVRSPDILVHEEARLVAVKDASGALLLSSGRTARLDGETWLRRAGQERGGSWPREGYSADGQLACDSLGCVYRRDGHIVAIAWQPDALAEDCRLADLVISAAPVRGSCPSARRIIDRFDLWREGSHAVWLDAGKIRIESVRATRGIRPWVAPVPAPRRTAAEGESVAPQQADEPALDADPVGPEDAGLVGGIGGLESN